MTAPGRAGLRLRERLRGRGAGAMVVVVLAALVGFLLIGQVQGPRRPAPVLAAETEGDLARILAGLNTEADALQAEIADLKIQLNDLRRSSESDAAAAQAVIDQLRSLQVLAGTVAVTGSGVAVTVADTSKVVGYDAMIDIVQELRDAGAEAVAVNGRRVGVASAFSDRAGAIVLDGITLSPPYRVEAIGQPATLDGGLKIPGGAVDAISALKGVRIQVERQAKVTLPALAEPITFRAARPVASGQ
ncbi:MAG: DUF881 domain-containing protein [Acidimicrobiales bacterium]